MLWDIEDGSYFPGRRVPAIDRELRRNGLRRVTRYSYKPGDCLFDSVFHILKSYSPVQLRKKTVGCFGDMLREEKEAAVEWEKSYLSIPEVLLELHPELRMAESPADEYLRRMRLRAENGGLWGDHFCVFWLQEALQITINVWMAETAKVIPGKKFPESEQRPEIQVVYHSRYPGYDFAHYEPVMPLSGDSDSDEEYVMVKKGANERRGWRFPWFGKKVEDEDSLDEPPEIERWRFEEATETEEDEEEEEEEEEVSVEDYDEVFGQPLPKVVVEEVIDNRCFEEHVSLKRCSDDDLEPSKCKRRRPEPDMAEEEGWVEVKIQQETTKVGLKCVTNFQVYDVLRDRVPTTEKESLVYKYLSESPAAEQSAESLAGLHADPLLSQLSPRELLEVANMRPNHPRLLDLIVQGLDRRFSDEQIQAMVATISKTLPGKAKEIAG